MDLKLVNNGNGGDLLLQGNKLAVSDTISNQIYIALYGGGNNDFWGNDLFTPLVSETQKTLQNLVLTPQNRLKLEDAIKKDLSFLGSDYKLTTKITNVNRVDIAIEVNGKVYPVELQKEPEPIATVPYLPPVTVGLKTCYLSFDAVAETDPADKGQHVQPWVSRYPDLLGTNGIRLNPGGVAGQVIPNAINGNPGIYYGNRAVGGYSALAGAHVGRDCNSPDFESTRAMTVFVVINPVASPGGYSEVTRSSAIGNNGISIRYNVSLGRVELRIWGDVDDSYITAQWQINKNYIICATFDTTQPYYNQIQGWLNGSDQPFAIGDNYLVENTNVFNSGSNYPIIGNSINGVQKVDGFIGAIMYYNRALSRAERLKVTSWLKKNYNI